MPFSHFYQLNEIVKLIAVTNPKSVLDVGVGFGMYGYLSRIYLELSDGREKYNDWQRRIEGIEVFEKYLTPVHDYIYNKIHIGEASTVLPKLEEKFDLVLLIDVLEHFEQDAGLKMIQLCLERGSNLIISTPNKFWAQQDSFDNPYETHRSIWTRKDFAAYPQKFFVRNDYSLICYLGQDAARVKRFLLKQRIYQYRDKIRALFS